MRRATSKNDFERQRQDLVENVLRLLGIKNEAVLQAMCIVPREEFVDEELREFAYRNAPLPIAAGQTISQPLIVGVMAEAVELEPDERVLEIGTGSGYSAAVLSRIAKDVFTIERHRELADSAAEPLKRLGYSNVHLRCADGSRGWPEEAPFDAIVVTAGSPRVPPALLEQLRIGGRLVIPVGDEQTEQQLMRVVRRENDKFDYEELGAVRFVPLIGEQAWQAGDEIERTKLRAGPAVRARPSLPELIRKAAEPIATIETANLQPLLERIGNARLVLIGEASHGTSEFYRFRAEMETAVRHGEELFDAAEMDAFLLPLAKSRNQQLTTALAARRLERAIGVVYRPETERLSHYFDASLANQFDEWIWFDETSAVRPLSTEQLAEHEPPRPFAVLDR